MGLMLMALMSSFSGAFGATDGIDPSSDAPVAQANVSSAVSATAAATASAVKTDQSFHGAAPAFSDPALAAEFTRVNALSQGFGSAVASTGTRGSGDLPTVNQESLKNYITSGQLKTLVLERIKSIDGSSTVFQIAKSAWQEMRERGLEKDIADSPYSPSVSCDGGTTPGAANSTQPALKAEVCWNLSYLVANHASLDTLVVLAVHAEAVHFGLGEDTAFLVGEMVGTALP
jgi:hypothetical protein